MQRKTSPALIVVVSDLHCGSLIGLLPPGTDIDGEVTVTPRLRSASEWLWGRWQDFLKETKRAALRRRVYVIANGDLIDGQVKDSPQVWTSNHVIQEQAARAALAPLVEIADKLFVIRGTEAHVGGMGKHEESIASWYAMNGPGVRSDTGTFSWWEFYGEIGGVLIEAAHHTSAGRMPWTSGNAANRLAAETVQVYAERHDEIPRLAFRSHVHRHQDSGINNRACRAIITPAWQLRTAYGHRIAARPADVGGVLVTTDGHNIEEVRAILYAPERKRAWRENE